MKDAKLNKIVKFIFKVFITQRSTDEQLYT